ncbi:MAG: hypothetical protein JSR17_02210 [Proteobacteria bacterium]|nr:hypothetical protein [Pseudomonadota bacterium]
MLAQTTTDTNITSAAATIATNDGASQIGFYGKLALSALAGAAVLYYSGPLASVAAREAFTQAYTWRYGVPSGLSYWTTFMPLREHVGNYAYQYGPTIAGSVALPATYKTVDGLTWVGKKIANIGQLFKAKKPVIETSPTQDVPVIVQTTATPIEVKHEVKEEVKQEPQVKIVPQHLDDDIEALIASFELLQISDEKPAEVKIDPPANDEDLGLTFLFELKKEPTPLATQSEAAASCSDLKLPQVQAIR